ncbi:DUF4783 domain-containing protein [Spirosoma utsteinense]|uniref:DUF4783 domain-containing protein n=1 Tax=Spirosoma utsteinense TaxID=2585773 RepID=A0ABR6WB69_9BACT|nr:DUF4783 domain-containing protein [Spirosoma utsteinense]MBC3788506.1 hypothetical protein [Spirosoma utsteinense]MBC3793180.1 hypothetical protein [Spirosoma utsteinense]
MNLVICSLLTITLWSSRTRPAADIALTKTVRTSLASGNARQLSTHFAKTVELVIDTENVDFSSVGATHAEIILRSFFRKHPPHRFQFVYRGSSEQLLYSTGIYETDGQTFDVYILMRQTRDRQFVINTLHFRKE